MKQTCQIFLILILLTFSCKGQEINYLTEAEYNAIFIDGVNWNKIHETKGDIVKIKALFGDRTTYKTFTEPSLGIEFWNKGFYFRFEDGSDQGNQYDLVNISILNNLSSLTIKGKTITIGEDIRKLGIVKINTDKNGIKGIMFNSIEPSNSAIFIEFNQFSNIIKHIEYIVFN
jgi:hypothetical protein